MENLIYVTGGARSGKSFLAESIVKEQKNSKKIYIATSIPFDDEMKERVKNHKIQRGDGWTTVEAYKNLDEELERVLKSDEKQVILMDCLTNMVNNIMFDSYKDDWDKISQEKVNEIEAFIKCQLERFLDFIEKNKNLILVIVSNEVGMGLVPEYALGRYFRDIAGRMNQIVAKRSGIVYLAVSGIAVKIK